MPENTSILDLLKRYETADNIFFDQLLLFSQVNFSEENKALLERMHFVIKLIGQKISNDEINKFAAIIKNNNDKDDFWFVLRFVWELTEKFSVHKKKAACRKAGIVSGKKREETLRKICQELETPLIEALMELKKRDNAKGAMQETINKIVDEFGDEIKIVMEKYHSRRYDAKAFFKHYLTVLISKQEEINMEDGPLRVYRRKRNRNHQKRIAANKTL